MSPRHGDDDPTREIPTGRPSVRSTPPSRARLLWAAVPHHLGRARTSTVVLTILFLAVGTLYLNVRPPVTGVGTVQEPAGSTQPAEVPEEPTEPTETAVPTEPTETAETTEPTTTSRSTEPTTTPPQTEETTPEETTEEEETAETGPGEPTTTRAPASEAPATTSAEP
ncbi:hypothetical protein [Geodermatophilus sabuli]|uniref:Uncharacterized protein n=1 Tax=Geodermatophilus sabuli TaxID=1564158 RepID=A0A285EB42_9ACTN|nr:hypothetical protein [Geodermatophilus sabuli]MBB3085277.1 outer membrane biosynthesis protein TonB [Geodermatophilus sabuli]SNX95316.1 hypothetical protein SAMN06893097_10210 [Geodermatophilus sabuli]